MYEQIKKYIKRSKIERQAHLALHESCIEIGGDHRNLTGLLAHFLKTTIPVKMKGKVCLCHACHNRKCSNPKHLYWGTYSENELDAYANGKINPMRVNRLRKRVKDYGSLSGCQSDGVDSTPTIRTNTRDL